MNSRPCMYGWRTFGIRRPYPLSASLPKVTELSACLWGLIVLDETAECSFGGTESSIKHVNESDLLLSLPETESDVERPRL